MVLLRNDLRAGFDQKNYTKSLCCERSMIPSSSSSNPPSFQITDKVLEPVFVEGSRTTSIPHAVAVGHSSSSLENVCDNE